MNKNLLIITKDQFGYHIHTHKYCEYLKRENNVTCICWDFGQPKIDHVGLNVKYIARKGNKLLRYFRFIRELNNEISLNRYDLIFIKYFYGVSIIRLLNRKAKINIDIRTNAIRKDNYLRFLYNLAMRFDCSFFSNVSIISGGLAESLKLKKWHVLPLGGDCFAQNEKSFESIHLLYVGTLFMRNILDCVKGFHKYLNDREPGNRIDAVFTIIGDAAGKQLQEINEYIAENHLEKFIVTMGYIHYSELHNYFEQANVGVSYIPITSYFDNQPPTKTYEYLLSGMPVIATRTKENVNIMNEDCGVLIDDNSESFALGIATIIANRAIYKSETIRNLYKKNLWENIMEHNLKNYIAELTGK